MSKCIHDGCNIQSSFNYVNVKPALYCNKHKLPNMINVRNRTCIYENCKIRPNYNYKNIK